MTAQRMAAARKGEVKERNASVRGKRRELASLKEREERFDYSPTIMYMVRVENPKIAIMYFHFDLETSERGVSLANWSPEIDSSFTLSACSPSRIRSMRREDRRRGTAGEMRKARKVSQRGVVKSRSRERN